jgi:tetratricopeptide (TPR) repeat protein
MAEDVLAEGITLYKRRSYSDALAYFFSLPDDSGADSLELSYYIGLCYTRLERYDDALLYLEQVVTAGSNINRILQCRYLLAFIYVQTGRKKLAQFELNKLIDAGYRISSVYASLAYIAWQQDDGDTCVEFYRKSLANDPDNVTALNGIGYVLACQNKELTEALMYCKRALDKAPDSAACMDSLGWVYYKLGLMKEAEKFTRQAAARCKQNDEINGHLQQILESRDMR